MTDLISSPQNPRIKAVAALRESRARRESGRILIDGYREVERAIDAGVVIDEAYHCDSNADESDGAGAGAGAMGDAKAGEADAAPRLLARLRDSGALVTRVAPRVFEKIGYGDRTEGIVAIADRPRRALGDLKFDGQPLVAIIEGLEKPGNIGAILRSADAAGVAAVIVTDPASDPYGPNAIRASTGAIFTVPLVESTRDETREWLVARAMQIVAASPDADRVYTDFDFARPTAIVLGSEARGLSEAWRVEVAGARVPMKGRADSLNVSVTAALFFFEVLRQRM